MAKAIAKCTCKECGDIFIRTTTSRNRSDADSWERWAIANFDLCSRCYGVEQRKKEEATPPTLTVSLDPYGTAEPVIMTWSGNTKPIKDEIKSLGYRWSDLPMSGVFGALDFKPPKMGWNSRITVDDLENHIKSVENALPETVLVNNISEIDFAVYQQIDKERKDKEDEMSDEIRELGAPPVRPECLPKGKWNGRIYGKKGKYRIYVDNEEMCITDGDAEDIEKFHGKISEYNAKIQDIRKRFS